jgi:glycosyltransferase involved in cell wall biosynthesis
MRIGIDARLINESGIGRYIRNLLSNLSAIDNKNEYFILLKNKDLHKFNFGKNFTNVEADFNWYSLIEQIKLPKLLDNLNLDLTHFPHFNVPVLYKGKFVVTIHDLIHQHFKMKRATTLDPLTYQIKQFGYRKVFKFAIEKSEKIIVPSMFVKSQLGKEWKVDDKKIKVTKEGVEEKLLTLKNKLDKSVQNKLLAKIGVKKPFLFYIGNAHPHKNVESLIKAFRLIKKDFPELSLVLSGADHYFWRRVKFEFKGPDIIYTGFVTDEVLAILFSNAEMFVMPSLEEGFGIPVLESFACSCPVVCSDIGSLKEVGGEGCIYFNPKSIDDISEKIKMVLNNEKLKQSLMRKGAERVKLFSWKKLAEETIKIYERV